MDTSNIEVPDSITPRWYVAVTDCDGADTVSAFFTDEEAVDFFQEQIAQGLSRYIVEKEGPHPILFSLRMVSSDEENGRAFGFAEIRCEHSLEMPFLIDQLDELS